MHNTLSLEADYIHQSKTTSGSTSVNTPVQALKHWEMHHLNMKMVGHQHYDLLDPTCIVSTVQAAGGGECFLGVESFESHSLSKLSFTCS